MKNDPDVRHKLDKVLQEAYDEAYGETLGLDSPEMVESDDDVPMVDEPDQAWKMWFIIGKFPKRRSCPSRSCTRSPRPFQDGASLCQVPSLWESPELYDHWKLLATCGKQAVLSSSLEARTSSKEGRDGIFQPAPYGR